MSDERIVGEFSSWKEVIDVLTEIELPCVITPAFSIHAEQIVDRMSNLRNAVINGLNASPTGKIQIKSVSTNV